MFSFSYCAALSSRRSPQSPQRSAFSLNICGQRATFNEVVSSSFLFEMRARAILKRDESAAFMWIKLELIKELWMSARAVKIKKFRSFFFFLSNRAHSYQQVVPDSVKPNADLFQRDRHQNSTCCHFDLWPPCHFH